MTAKQPYRFIITGGGTGGHIYPAIAVANNIKKRYLNAEILFVGAIGKMEMWKVPEFGYKIKGLWISGFQRKATIQNVFFLFKVVVSFFVALKLVKQFKPHVVIGFGGYASGPILMAANKRNIPVVIQEQNSHAGLVNRKLSKKVKYVCVAYQGMDKYFSKERIVFTGNPVRSDIVDLTNEKRERGVQFFNLSADKKTILVLGGSLGAKAVNDAIMSNIDLIDKEGVQLLWQTGKIYHEEIQRKLALCPQENVCIVEFILAMDQAYACADVVISRAGALCISEMCLAKKPIILVPSPNVVEDHQTKNAMALVENDAAILVEDAKANTLMLRQAIDLVKDEKKKATLSENIAEMGRPNATVDIVNIVMSCIK